MPNTSSGATGDTSATGATGATRDTDAASAPGATGATGVDQQPVADSSQAREIEIDADKARVLLDDLTLDRIIDAVRPNRSEGLDRDMLRHDLLVCFGQFSIASGPGQSGFYKRQSERLKSIQKHALKLIELLKDDDTDLRIIRRVWPITPERPAHLLPQITFLVETIDAMTGMQGKPADLAERTKTKIGMSGSALRWLTGMLLPAAVLEAFSKRSRGKSK